MIPGGVDENGIRKSGMYHGPPLAVANAVSHGSLAAATGSVMPLSSSTSV